LVGDLHACQSPGFDLGASLNADTLNPQIPADEAAAIDSQFAANDGADSPPGVESALNAIAMGEGPLNLPPVDQDIHGIVHVFAARGTDLINVYEFGSLGITFNGRIFEFVTSSVSDVEIHFLDDSDLVSIANQVRPLVGAVTVQFPAQKQGDTALEENSGSASIDAEGESQPPVFTGFIAYEDDMDMFLVRGSVQDDGEVWGLTVSLWYNGELVDEPPIRPDGSFVGAFYVEPPAWGYVEGQFQDTDGNWADTVFAWIDNPD
jgi:hypothetical protein